MKSYLLLVCVLILTSCSSVDIENYKDNVPELNLASWFNGNLSASGIVKNRSGVVTRYFNASIEASWDKGVGTLKEKFVFSDGEVQYRTWTLKEKSKNIYAATANDVVGESEAKVAGNALFMNYILTVTYKDGSLNLNVDDKMYLVNESTLINESTLTKFGIEVAYVKLVIKKL